MMAIEEEDLVQTTIRIPRKLLTALRYQSLDEKRSMSKIALTLLEGYMKEVEAAKKSKKAKR